MQFRGLRPDEIEVRVGTVGKKGASLLLYKDARCDMNILDETFGSLGWQRDHKEIKDNMYAGVGVFDGSKNEWVWKWDCGTESQTEKEKGEASDSFKRACFNWGIGRELYTGGFIFVQCETVPDGNKFKLSDKFEFSGTKVSKIMYSESDNKREITGIEIKSKNGKVIYSTLKGNQQSKGNSELSQDEISKIENEKVNLNHIASIRNELNRTGVKEKQILAACEIAKLEEMTFKQWTETMSRLENTSTKQQKDLGLK